MALQEVKPDQSPEKSGKPRTISVRWLMALTFGGLVAISIFLVLAVSVYTNFTNTFSLLSEQTLSSMASMESRIADNGRQAENVLESVEEAYNDGNFDLENIEQQNQLFNSLMTAAPIVEGLFIYKPDGGKSGVLRRNGSNEIYTSNRGEDADTLSALNVDASRGATGLLWGNPVKIHDVIYLNLSIPLVKGDTLEAVAVALIGTQAINRVIGQLGEGTPMTVFVLDDRQNLIAHSKKPLLFAKQPLYRLYEFPDDVLAALDTADGMAPMRKAQEAGIDIRETDGKDGSIFMLKKLEGYTDKPLILGAYVNKVEVGDEIFRAAIAAIVGAVMMVLAVIIAVMIGQRLARPMTRIADAAALFSNFEMEKYKKLPPSRVTEINDQANALNSMHTVMDEFSHYIPKTVVKRLVHSGTEGTRSVEREVTIMFTDIVGFTTLSEKLNAIETANLLNEHFAIVCGAVNETGGTIDKFMGDNVMAFWGAPTADDQHAAHAISTARAITERIKAENAERKKSGLEPIRVRIGIHTGRVVVGNIGGGGRQNYTIVGDAVNIAQRLEQLGKEISTGQEVITLMSKQVTEAANNPDDINSVGSWPLRGREKPVSVFAFTDDMLNENNGLSTSLQQKAEAS